MKIEIEKRKVIVDEIEFISEIKRICLLQEKVHGHIRVAYKTFKNEMKLKITELEFMQLCFELKLETYKNLIVIKQFTESNEN
ncbi:MAG: hypothetical protein WCT77_04105 [Bacteroidota bacterium]